MVFVFAERLLAAQNPLSKASLPHQLFADAPVASSGRRDATPITVPLPPSMMFCCKTSMLSVFSVSVYVRAAVCTIIISTQGFSTSMTFSFVREFWSGANMLI